MSADRFQAEVMDELRQQEEKAMSLDLLKINVNDHTEKKNGLSYLSWAWAWAEVLKVDPLATWVVHTYGPQGCEEPCMRVGKTAMVHVSVTINKLRRECMLPVMDHRNKAIQEPDAFQVNTAIMRCMTKAISMHGLGLYLYAGEDLPEGEEVTAKPQPVIAASFRSSPTDEIVDISQDRKRDIELAASAAAVKFKTDKDAAFDLVEKITEDNDSYVYLWQVLKSNSTLRAYIKMRRESKSKVQQPEETEEFL